MKFFIVISTFYFLIFTDFKSEQQKFDRVKTAYKTRFGQLETEFKDKGLDLTSKFSVYLRAFKEEKELEVWIKPTNKSTYQLFKTYAFCKSSGELGPKVKEGDYQTPEGFYYINRFNPKSNFHLSLGLNYPNATDKIRSGANKPGGDIFIHGNCVTIGCIPITDEKIEELYIVCVEAKNNGQSKIPVHIFPAKLTNTKMDDLSKKYSKELLDFWKTLHPQFTDFERTKKI